MRKPGTVRFSLGWALCIVSATCASFAHAEEPAMEEGSAAPEYRAPPVVSAPPPSVSDDEYGFQWLDPDKKVYVLQNRRYLKSGRAMLSLMGGVSLTTPYRTVYGIEPRFAYYFSEAFGIEGFYAMNSNSQNSTFEALQNAAPDTLPVVREYRTKMGAVIHWVPWYAKINVFNKILYFDWYLAGGLGNIRTEIDVNRRVGQPPDYVEETAMALFVGTGHLYHLSENWVARFDMMSSHYRAPLLGTSGEDTWFSDYTFNIGIGYRF